MDLSTLDGTPLGNQQYNKYWSYANPSYVPEIVLTEKDLKTIKYSIEKIFDYYCMDQKKIFTEDDETNVVNILSPSFNVVASMSSQINEQEYMFNRMTQEQSYLLDYLEEQNVAAIQGGAGTAAIGK